jgi:hypothetical protein
LAYSSTLDNGNALSTVGISFDDVSLTYTIYTTDFSHVGTHTVKIICYSTDEDITNESETFDVEILDIELIQPSGSDEIDDQFYTV